MTLSPAACRLMTWAPIHPGRPANGTTPADRDTARLLEFIAAAGAAGVTRNAVREYLFQRHKRSADLDALLEPLKHSGRITETSRPTTGRPATVYTIRTRKDT